MVPAIGPEHITIAERLKEAGYANAFLGKWHIAPSAGPRGKVAPEHSPLSQGFDINIGGGSYGGPPSFFSPYRNATLPDGEPGEYLPDRLVDETIDFIRDHKAKPWMVHLWFYTVHWPMQAPKELLAKVCGPQRARSKRHPLRSHDRGHGPGHRPACWQGA